MSKYNILLKGVKGKEYIITDMIATSINEKDFENMKKYNKFLEGYRFCKYSDTDFSWWCKISKYLTKTRLYNGVYFECDFNGNITKY